MSVPPGRHSLRVQGRASTRLRSSSSSRSETSSIERLTDNLLIEILSWVPAKSLCRFKCVCKHWLSLIHHPEHRRKLPQTLVGFLFNNAASDESARQFTSIPGNSSPLIDTSFAFLPNHRRLDLLDCCNGLLLCRWYSISTEGDEFRYVVCNPATQKCTILPDPSHAVEVCTTRLGFDPTVSSHFHVFVLLEEEEEDHGDCYITEVYEYSSETDRWIHKENGWIQGIGLHACGSGAAFHDGHMHFYCYDYDLSCPYVVVMHAEGESWTSFDPSYYVEDGFIQQSQGSLHYAGFKRDDEDEDVVRLVVYILQDYGKDWIVKHIVKTSCIPEINRCKFDWIAIHPDRNLIFFTTGPDAIFMCYDMDHQQARVVCNLEECRRLTCHMCLSMQRYNHCRSDINMGLNRCLN